jgi:hypothetical protein
MTDRELLEQALGYMDSVGKGDMYAEEWAIAEAIRTRLAQPEPELKIWQKKNGEFVPVKQPEPVAWMFQHEETESIECIDTQQVKCGFEKNNPSWQKSAPLYTAPPKKEWVGLMDEEIWHMSQFNCGTRGEFARAIEAKLKEKNT